MNNKIYLWALLWNIYTIGDSMHYQLRCLSECERFLDGYYDEIFMRSLGIIWNGEGMFFCPDMPKQLTLRSISK